MAWCKRPKALDGAGPLMYLGEGEHWLVLYDTERKQTLRLPTGQAVLVRPLQRD
jgi:hypothetical protein